MTSPSFDNRPIIERAPILASPTFQFVPESEMSVDYFNDYNSIFYSFLEIELLDEAAIREGTGRALNDLQNFRTYTTYIREYVLPQLELHEDTLLKHFREADFINPRNSHLVARVDELAEEICTEFRANGLTWKGIEEVLFPAYKEVYRLISGVSPDKIEETLAGCRESWQQAGIERILKR